MSNEEDVNIMGLTGEGNPKYFVNCIKIIQNSGTQYFSNQTPENADRVWQLAKAFVEENLENNSKEAQQVVNDLKSALLEQNKDDPALESKVVEDILKAVDVLVPEEIVISMKDSGSSQHYVIDQNKIRS